MERRSCSNLHFISAIKGNSVSKLCNVNTCSKPALMFKKLKDIYNTGDLRTTSESLQSDSENSSDGVMIEKACLPVVANRNLREVDHARNEAVCSSSDSDDNTFKRMTLKQLKQKCKLKKKACSSSAGLKPLQGHAKLETKEDESDLEVPLSSLKMKSSKAKRKCTRSSSESPKPSAFNIMSEQGQRPESLVQFHGGSHLLTHVKTEVPEPELEGCQSSSPFKIKCESLEISDFQIKSVQGQHPETQVQFLGGLHLITHVKAEVSDPEFEGNNERVKYPSLGPDIDGEENQSCALNQVSYDHLEHVRPLRVILPSFEDIMDVSNEEGKFQQFLEMPISEIEVEEQIERPLETTGNGEHQSLDTTVLSRSCHLHEFSEQSSNPVKAEVSEPEIEGNNEKVEYQSLVPGIDGEENQSCALNQVSYDHLEHVKPLCMLLSSFEDIMDVNNEEERCQQFQDMPISEIEVEGQVQQPLKTTARGKHQSLDTNGFSRSCHLHEFSMKSSNPVVQVSELVADDSVSIKEPYYGGESCLLEDVLNKNLTTDHKTATSGSHHRTCRPSWSPHRCSSTEEKSLFSRDGKIKEKQRLNGSITDEVINNVELQHEFSSDEKKTAISTQVHVEREYTSQNRSCAFVGKPSPSGPDPTPERLLSTRKVVSPTSEERISLAMGSTESCYTMDLQDCKENLCAPKQTENRSFSEGSDKPGDASKISSQPIAVSKTKFILSPSQVQRKTKHERTSPPKDNLEGPRLPRSRPRFTTGSTSESAIAFSRRQMHDMESLATKLMSELKSMKDIVEEKLLFEAYRNVPFKNDADEVKNAITNATKVEESAKKWLCIMGRDCNRFCKIMSLTQKCATPASADAVQRKRKRIAFADEAGGMLCHVKLFENDPASPDSDNENKKD